jgi:hypothetical protein
MASAAIGRQPRHRRSGSSTATSSPSISTSAVTYGEAPARAGGGASRSEATSTIARAGDDHRARPVPGREDDHPAAGLRAGDAHPGGRVERRQRPPADHRDPGVRRLPGQPPRPRVGHHLGDGGERERERPAADLALEQAPVEPRPLRLVLVGRRFRLDVAGPGGDQAPQARPIPWLVHLRDDIQAPEWAHGRSCENAVR